MFYFVEYLICKKISLYIPTFILTFDLNLCMRFRVFKSHKCNLNFFEMFLDFKFYAFNVRSKLNNNNNGNELFSN